MAQLTGNPANLMSGLQKGNAFTNYQMSSLTPKSPKAGVTAVAPEQNITKPTNTLTPKQTSTTPVPTNKTFNPQENTGLLAALSRQTAGTANDADNKNIAYAQSKGWKAPTPTATSTTATPVKPTDVTSGGILTSLVDTANQGSPVAQQASQGLIGTAQANPATSGQAYTDYQTAIDELNALKSTMATQTAGISSTGIPLEFQQGRQGILNTQYASQLDAAQQKVNQAQQAISQQITGTQTQQAGYTGAGNLGQTGQGLQQSGLTSAAQLAQPVQVPYSNQYINPQTGESVGGAMGGSMQQAVSNIAEKVFSGNMGYDAGVSALGGYGQAGINALQQALGSNFNIQQSNAQAQAQGASTLQTGTVGGLLSKAADSANQALVKLETDFNRLSSLQTGGIPATNSIANWIAEKFGQGELSAYQTTLKDTRAQIQGVLTASGGVDVITAGNMASTYLPDNMTPTMFKEKLNAAKALISQKVQAFTNQNSNQGSNQGGGSQFDW